MSIDGNIYQELAKLGFDRTNEIKITEIRNKDGVFLFRIKTNEVSYVLKYFSKEEYRREIRNYKLLKDLGIKTIKFYGYTNRSILLEDLETSQKYRLGRSEDLKDKEIAKALAIWYKDLHSKGVDFLENNETNYYSEMDEITVENIKLIRAKSNTINNLVWDLILNNFKLIKLRMYSLEQTLNYNDFYCTNLVVSKDKSEAFMFDYNFLGIGFRYSDIRNVCSSLSKESAEVFRISYGNINFKERIIDSFIAPIITLIFAYKREVFPSWAKEYLDYISNGKLEKTVKKLLGII